MVREYGEMDVIIEEGLNLQHIYVLASGTVEVMNSKKGLKRVFGHRRIGSITAPNVFGVEEAILEFPAEFTYHASSESTLLLIPKEQVISLFADSPIFANNISSRTLQTLSAFTFFQDFCRAIFGRTSLTSSKNSNGTRLSMATLVSLYKSSGTLFHKSVNEKNMDTEALRYCVRRLPTNITTTYIIILSSSLPDYISNEFVADASTEPVSASSNTTLPIDTGRRRRCAWAFGGGGQTLIVMRDQFTDTIDFVSNLCMYIVESRKLRMRLQQLVSPTAVEILRRGLTEQAQGRSNWKQVFEHLPFSPSEVETLLETWEDQVLFQLYNVLLHREEYVVHLESSHSIRFSQDAYTNWSLTLYRHMKTCMNLGESDTLPTSVVIDVVFSPNRTFKNLFCSMATDFKEYVEKLDNGEGKGGIWKNNEDRYYYILTGLLEKEPAIRDAYRARLEANGFVLFEDAHSSALMVDLVDVEKLCVEDSDSSLQTYVKEAKRRAKDTNETRFIINVDKTFGSQIEAVLRSFLLTFGSRIKSVNLTGKAGGLVGNRGDVILPSKLLFSKQSFGEDSTDEVRLCNENSLALSDLGFVEKSCKSSQVHRGALITVPGFVFQSRPILKFYKTVHGCSALDLQSSYVARQLEECRRTGVLSKKVTSRYLFYCDEMPLGNENGTEIKPQKREIISAIYATARTLFSKILE
ncbi:cyclic nucleotide-binding protein [Angomonas deanei]|nr:cyclic nucleotide-binding protein [Angomonas deanei]|eukprot:EPY42945.1 cyclic nucleotide-binding protein [Angomonas deanei]